LKRYDLIVFDWDGTLMDSTGLIARCIQWAAEDLTLQVPDEQAAKQIIGLGLQDSTRQLFPDLSDADQLRFATRFRHHYIVRDHEAPLYEGVRDMLADLKREDRFMAVATGKPRAGLARSFEHTRLGAYFDFTRCADEGFPKPHPDMLERLMAFTGTEPHQAIMIGDTTHDLQLAANAGVDSVAVGYGAHDRTAFAAFQPRVICDSVPDLHRWLKNNA